MRACFLKEDAEQHFTLATIVFLIFRRAIIAGNEAGQTPPSKLRGLILTKIQETGIFLRSPRKAINAKKAQRVIDTQKVKNLSGCRQTTAPPCKIIPRHGLPIVKGEPPVLPPFFGKRIAFENLFRRSTTGSVKIKDARLSPYVGTIDTHSDWNIAHESHAQLIKSGPNGLPLRHGDPLHIAEKTNTIFQGGQVLRRELTHPLLRSLGGAMLKRPVRYNLIIPVPRHQSAENGIVMQPLAFLCLKIPQFPPAGLVPLRAIQVLVSGLEELSL